MSEANNRLDQFREFLEIKIAINEMGMSVNKILLAICVLNFIHLSVTLWLVIR